MSSPVIAGDGVPDAYWRAELTSRPLPTPDLGGLRGRVVVLAAHPDDEVLGVGGLLAHLGARGVRPLLAWATDGEASHPDAPLHLVQDLAATRRAESLAAVDELGVRPDAVLHLGLPDSGLREASEALQQALSDLLRPDDLVLAPWAGDGHPDHEAVGAIAGRLRGERGFRLWQYPIWAWHWAAPGDPALPWDTATGYVLAPSEQQRKARAVERFISQIAPLGPEPGCDAVLSPAVLARFARPVEVLFP